MLAVGAEEKKPLKKRVSIKVCKSLATVEPKARRERESCISHA